MGDDAHGVEVVDRAKRDGIDTACVVRRPGTATGLVVDVVDSDAQWRYLRAQRRRC